MGATMTFDRLHRIVTLGVIACGLGALHFSGEFPIWVSLSAFLVSVAGVKLHPWFKANWIIRAAGVVTAIAGIAFLWLAISDEDYLYWAIIFAIFLGAVKSLMLRNDADFMQMYALTFLHVMAAAVVNPGISFGVLMFPYVILLVLGLQLTNLRKGIQGQALEGAKTGDLQTERRLNLALARRDLIHGGFISVTVGVTLSVFLISLVFFFIFPRLGFGFFAQQSRRGMAMTGFSDQVNLGDFGNIAEDLQVVMRVKSPNARLPLRMRGQSLDFYDGKSWKKTTHRRRPMVVDSDGIARVGRGLDPLEGVVAQEIYLEPLAGSPRVLFGMSTPVAYQRPPNALEALRPKKWRFFRDLAGDVVLTGPDAVSIVYTAYSEVPDFNPQALRVAGNHYDERLLELYTELPPLNPLVEQLASDVAAGQNNPYDIAQAIVSFFHKEFSYSLNSSHGDYDPLADFLLNNREGHCEYFASGMVILLRQLGIPVRIVNGFAGGIYNEYGDYFALRKSDAHSWVEVYFPDNGWVTFDPTPPAFLTSRTSPGLLASLMEAMDAVQLAWYRWVVEYNLEKQISFLSALFSLKKDNENSFTGANSLTRNDIRQLWYRLKALPWGYFGLALLLIPPLGIVFVRLLRTPKKKKLGDQRDPAVKAYNQLRRELKSKGYIKAPTETQLDFAKRVGAENPELYDHLMTTTWAYLEAVFNPKA